MIYRRDSISLPPALARGLDERAQASHTSFSALVVELLERDPAPVPYAGIIQDEDPDLSLKVQDVLRRLIR